MISPSRISHAHRLLERRALPSGRVVWQIFDYLREKVNSPFLEPLGYVGSGTEYVFSLSNGLFAFVTPNPNDAFVTETPVPLDTLEYSLPARTPVACWGCHASGLIAAQDDLRGLAFRDDSDYLRSSGLDAEDVALLEQIYPEPAALLELFASDTAVYQRALTELGLPTIGPDPVAAASLRFGAPLTMRDAAAELGLHPEALATDWPRHAPWLAPLGRDAMDRDAFTAVYSASLCVLSGSLANRPDAAACARAIDALGGP